MYTLRKKPNHCPKYWINVTTKRKSLDSIHHKRHVFRGLGKCLPDSKRYQRYRPDDFKCESALRSYESLTRRIVTFIRAEEWVTILRIAAWNNLGVLKEVPFSHLHRSIQPPVRNQKQSLYKQLLTQRTEARRPPREFVLMLSLGFNICGPSSSHLSRDSKGDQKL